MAQEEKLDWIYKGANSLVDREEYLLGRKVDKTLEQINEEEKEKKIILPTPKNHVEHECIPPSIRDFNKIVLSEQVDISAKLQEDPLVAIKKREEEARRQFLQNPVQLKKLQEALKRQEEKKKKHKKSKKKHSSDLDEKIKEKLRLLKQNSIGNATSKKKIKKNKEDALNVILMHKFNALKDKLSEEDMQDILNGHISNDSSEDTPKKNKTKSDSSESDNGKNKHRGEVSNKKHERNKKRDRSCSSGSDDGRNKEKKLTYSSKKYYSSEKDRRKNRSPYSRRDNSQRSSRESSWEDKYRKQEKKGSGREYGSKSKQERNKSRERSRSIERKVYRNKNSNSSRSKRRSSICSEEESKETERKDKTQRKENTKLSKSKYRKHSDSNSEEESNAQRQKKFKRNISDKSDNDLDEKILAKLRILRGEVETKIQKNSVPQGNYSKRDSSSSSDNNHDNQGSFRNKQKVLLPAKPSHLSKQKSNSDSNSEESIDKHKTKIGELRNQSESSHTSSSEEESIKKNYKYSDSEEEKPQPKAFGLVTSAGKKIALKKTDEYKKVNTQTSKKVEQINKPARKNIKKLTDEEKDKLRVEMIRNAQVRDKEREQNVKKYTEKDKKEEEKTHQNFDADAIHTKLLKSAKISSVEQRIKSNLNNIQRSSRHMDSNFSKR